MNLQLKNTEIDFKVSSKISKEFALQYNIMPYKEDENYFYILTSKALDNKVIKEIEFITLKKIKEKIVNESLITSFINYHYDKENLKKNIRKLKDEKSNKKYQIEKKENIVEAPAVYILNSIIKEAIENNSSDIHLEPFKEGVVVRARINGDLIKIEEFPIEIYENIIYRIKILSDMDISRKQLPQDGKMKFDFKNKNFDLRVSSLPTVYGEKFVIRILYKNDNIYNIHNLGFSNSDKEILKKLIKTNNGMILLTGPTGSGKTTTLYSLLLEIDRDRKNVITVENPVEYEIKKVNQVNINNSIGLNYSRALRSILRQDPDIIMVGEIIDEEAAEIAITSSLTGHLIFSTLHCDDAASSIIRLIDMKIPKYLVVDSLVAVISQRLVKKICPYCKKEYLCTVNESKDLGFEEQIKIYKGIGCEKCNNTGYIGRTMAYELVVIDDNHKNIIMKYEDINELRKYNFKKGAYSLREKLRNMVLEGITTYDEYVGNLKLNYGDKYEI